MKQADNVCERRRSSWLHARAVARAIAYVLPPCANVATSRSRRSLFVTAGAVGRLPIGTRARRVVTSIFGLLVGGRVSRAAAERKRRPQYVRRARRSCRRRRVILSLRHQARRWLTSITCTPSYSSKISSSCRRGNIATPNAPTTPICGLRGALPICNEARRVALAVHLEWWRNRKS